MVVMGALVYQVLRKSFNEFELGREIEVSVLLSQAMSITIMRRSESRMATRRNSVLPPPRKIAILFLCLPRLFSLVLIAPIGMRA
uniref:Uncharacterized protein n=1 Tax=Oryza barthii TaxID=65489 RepID=A0A0D3F0J3_9ORYZ